MSNSLAMELAAFDVELLEPVPALELTLESLGYGAVGGVGGTEMAASCCPSCPCSCCIVCCCCCCQ
jgi:hypothetical protein